MSTISIYFVTTAQEMKFSNKNFFRKCDQIRRKLRIWSHLLKKSLMGNCIFCAVSLINVICSANQLTGFHMIGALVVYGVTL